MGKFYYLSSFIIVVGICLGKFVNGEHNGFQPKISSPSSLLQTNNINNNNKINKKRPIIIPSSSDDDKSERHGSTTATAVPHGGGAVEVRMALRRKKKEKQSLPPPSMYWAVLHNWLYFVSLAFNALNIPFLIRRIVDGEEVGRSGNPSPGAIALSGKVESVDKFLTFAGIGFLSALSDRFGRKPLMAWSALGFMATNLIQLQATKSSIAMLYLADFIDGCSSCMMPLCQAYVTDVSPPSKRAASLGIFQGLSTGGAFCLAFPIGGLLGAKFGPRVPILIGAGLQFLNALVIVFLTPESNRNRAPKIDARKDNPIGGLVRLFGTDRLVSVASTVYFLASLAQSSLDAQFVNYSQIRFGWSQAQSGPLLVLVGLMLAVAPRLLVPLLGMKNSILSGLLVFGAGLATTGLSPTPAGFVSGIFVTSIGCVCLPALQALLANLARPGEIGAMLGAMGSVRELTGAIGSTLFAGLLATFTSDRAPLPLPGMHFVAGGGILLLAWIIAVPGFVARKDHPAFTNNNNTEDS